MRETKKIVLEVYPYEKIRDITIDIYIKNFSEKEIYGVIDFYKSPLGQKVLAKFPQMMQESNMRIQAFFMEKMPEIEKRMDAFLAEYNKKQRVK